MCESRWNVLKVLRNVSCFENCMNSLENWAKWISYNVLAIKKNCKSVVHKKKTNILFIQYIYFCVKINLLHVNWNLTIANSFLNTVVFPLHPTTTHSCISFYCSSTTSNCECSQFTRNTNVLYKRKYIYTALHWLWRSSSLKNGSDCAGQTLYICFQTWLIGKIVIPISLPWQVGVHFPVNFWRLSKNTQTKFTKCFQYSGNLRKTLQP